MRRRLIEIAAAAGIAVIAAASAQATDVNVYSYRQPFLVKPLFKAFMDRTGIKVNVVFAKKGLIERLRTEGTASPADLIFTVDIGRLHDAVKAGVVESVKTDTLSANIPASLRDPDGNWYGLTTRTRLIYASRDRVPEGGIETYEQLVEPEWKGRICTRSGKHVYMIALIASMIAHHGEEQAEEWLAGLKANLARRPQGNDRAQVKAIHAGECDVSIGNHYYYHKMLDDPKQKAWAESVRVVFPNQAGRGAHVNISGASLVKGAPNRGNAIALLEFASGEEGQNIYARVNGEYPVKPGVAGPETLAAFKADDLSLARVAELREEAGRMVDRVDYDG